MTGTAVIRSFRAASIRRWRIDHRDLLSATAHEHRTLNPNLIDAIIRVTARRFLRGLSMYGISLSIPTSNTFIVFRLFLLLAKDLRLELEIGMGRSSRRIGGPHDSPILTVERPDGEEIRYDVNIMRMKPRRTLPTASDPWKDFLSLPRRNRAARLSGPPELPIPFEASIRDGYLTWTWYSLDKGGHRVAPTPQKLPSTLCFDFAKLAGASDKQILRFADKWGPLGLDRREEERVDSCREHARLALALIRFAGERVTGGRGEDEDWQVICKSTPARAIDRKRMDHPTQMAIVASAVNTWFAHARGHGIITVDGDSGDLQVRPYASDLFGVLIPQIAHLIARSDQTALCAGCRDPFTPKRPIVRGSRQYCNGCRKAKLPQRDAARDGRRRVREKAGNGDDH